MPGIVEDCRIAARNAVAAGFDAVEVYAANGCLIDQFLRDGTNQRTDAYGGSVANRARFLFEVLDAVVGEIGADRVGIRLSPLSPSNDAQESDPQATYSPVIERLRIDAPLAEPDSKTFYGGDARGYTDYPTLGAAMV